MGLKENDSDEHLGIDARGNSEMNLSTVYAGGEENCFNESFESIDCNDPKQYLFANFNNDPYVDQGSKPSHSPSKAKWDSPSSGIAKQSSVQTNKQSGRNTKPQKAI